MVMVKERTIVKYMVKDMTNAMDIVMDMAMAKFKIKWFNTWTVMMFSVLIVVMIDCDYFHVCGMNNMASSLQSFPLR